MAVRTGITYPTLSGPKMIVPMKEVLEKGKNVVSPLVNALNKEGFNWGKFGFSTIVGTTVDIGLNDKTWQEAVPENLIKNTISLAIITIVSSTEAPLLIALGIDYLAVKSTEFVYDENLFWIKDITEGITNGLNYISDEIDEFTKWFGSIFDR